MICLILFDRKTCHLLTRRVGQILLVASRRGDYRFDAGRPMLVEGGLRCRDAIAPNLKTGIELIFRPPDQPRLLGIGKQAELFIN